MEIKGLGVKRKKVVERIALALQRHNYSLSTNIFFDGELVPDDAEIIFYSEKDPKDYGIYILWDACTRMTVYDNYEQAFEINKNEIYSYISDRIKIFTKIPILKF